MKHTHKQHISTRSLSLPSLPPPIVPMYFISLSLSLYISPVYIHQSYINNIDILCESRYDVLDHVVVATDSPQEAIHIINANSAK